MRRNVLPLLLVAALSLGAAVRAADDAGGRAPVAPKAGDKTKADTKVADTKPAEARAETVTKQGTLAKKPADAADGVIAMLLVKNEKAAKPVRTPRGSKVAKTADKDVTINLMAADGDVAAKVKELALKSAYVEVTGSLTGDVLKVTEIKETQKPADDTKKPAKRKTE